MQLKCHNITGEDVTSLDEQFRALHQVFQRRAGGSADDNWESGPKG